MSDEKYHGGNLIGRTLNKCESNRKKAMELGGRRTHSTSAIKPSSVSRTTRDETFCFPIYGRNSKEAVRAPLPATSGVHRAKQAIRKGGSSKGEPKASSVSPDARVSIGAHAHLVPLIRLVLKGDRGGTYRARTSGTNPPWQESYSMHDFGAPDAK